MIEFVPKWRDRKLLQAVMIVVAVSVASWLVDLHLIPGRVRELLFGTLLPGRAAVLILASSERKEYATLAMPVFIAVNSLVWAGSIVSRSFRGKQAPQNSSG